MRYGSVLIHERLPLTPREEAVMRARAFAGVVKGGDLTSAVMQDVGLGVELSRLYALLGVPVCAMFQHASAVQVLLLSDQRVVAIATGQVA